ncbi:TPA: hypothetical protein ROY01_001199 [Bacillus toyonensis]|nr:hypothetical protein [Bacillus toyonensis]
MNEEKIILHETAVGSYLIGSTLPPIFRHSFYQQEQTVLTSEAEPHIY